jgi:ubiquinone/menaquinone biosynthesis C-methylase UbiE
MTATAASSTRHLPPETYRSQAGHYDQRTDAFRLWRELLVQRLPLKRGDTVLDVGCGTGLCLPLLQHKVGRTGAIIGIDASEEMLQVAADRIAAHVWVPETMYTGPDLLLRHRPATGMIRRWRSA